MKTDIALQQDVLAELKLLAAVNVAEIGVEVKDGIVTLAGKVSSLAEKWHAEWYVEEAIQRISGVKALVVKLEIAMPGTNHRSDADIARSTENRLKWLMPNKNAVNVMVENGWITLSGEVDWVYQKQIANMVVRYLAGVRGVNDQIAIKPKASISIIGSNHPHVRIP